MKDVNIRPLWKFGLKTQAGINVPLWMTVGLQQKNDKIHKFLTMIAFIELQ